MLLLLFYLFKIVLKCLIYCSDYNTLKISERNKLLPPILVIEALSNTPSVKIGNVRNYLKKVITAELEKKNEQTGNIEKYDAETKEVKKSIDEFKTKYSPFTILNNILCLLSRSYFFFLFKSVRYRIAVK